LLPIATATLTNPTSTSRLELSARFFGQRTFPTSHRTFPSCAPNRVARSRSVPLDDAINPAGQRHLSIRPGEFSHAGGRLERPVSESVRVGGALIAADCAPSRESVDREPESGGLSLEPADQRLHPMHRLYRPPCRIDSPAHSPAWQANRRSVTNFNFLSLHRMRCSGERSVPLGQLALSREQVTWPWDYFIQPLGKVTRPRNCFSAPADSRTPFTAVPCPGRQSPRVPCRTL
jgi:hypothetical protein